MRTRPRRTRPAIRSRLALWPALLLAIPLLAPAALPAYELRFGDEELVQAGGSDLAVFGYSVPSLGDWDNDGLPDLVVGEGDGAFPGKVRVYLNTGTPAAPLFDAYLYAQSDSADLSRTGGG